ncbi:hypothetical protein SAY87_018884 [Trapa incisa]|uniref:PLATZ transcription factor family protein n=1 Tax=Trapa incisa TaxID=236973 RepID=A0AAN7K4V4_9MYRT|nr:hypothetical protein SAY87_018884 [Trapa incisa]
MGLQRVPAWLDALYTQSFFVGCSHHENAKKNEKNVCCLDCCTSICPHCIIPNHRTHRLLQIRRYVYHDVVRLEDLQNLIDCSNAYTINSAKVVFIKKRPPNRQFKGSGNYCTSCDRSLQEPFIHCSLGCKVDYILKYKKDLSPYLRTCKTLQLGPDFLFPQDMYLGDEDQATLHSTVVDSDEPMVSCSSGSSGSMEINNGIVNIGTFVRKKRSGLSYVWSRSPSKLSSDEYDMATSCMSRRKGIPHRSPLC